MDIQHSAQLNKEVRQHHGHMPSRNWYAALVLIVCLGLAVSAVLFRLATHQGRIRQQTDFALKAKDLANNIQQVLEHTLYENDAMSSFYAASQSVERDEFHKFVQRMLFWDPTIQILAWIPRVTDSERATFEEKTRREGYPNFQITEKSSQGSLGRSSRRAEYFPAHFLEPYIGNEPVMGFDLASEPSRLEALTRARDTGEKTATPRIVMVHDNNDQNGFLIFTPIYKNGAPINTARQRRQHLQGFVLGAYRIGYLIEKAISRLAPSGIDIRLFDNSAPADKRLLYFHASRLQKERHLPTADDAELIKGVHYTEKLSMAGRDWLLLCTPTPGSFTEGTSVRSWLLLSIGVLGTGLLAGYLWLIFSHIDTSRRYTAQLLLAKEGLEHEILERKLADVNLHAIKEQLSSLFNNSPVSLWLEDFSNVRSFLDELRQKGHVDLRTYFAEHPDAIAHAASLLKIVDVNQATLELYGAQGKEDLLAGLVKTFTAESYQAFSAGLIAIAEGKTKFEIETVTKTLSQENRNVVIKWSLIPMAGLQALSMVVSVLDITERKKAEDALRKHELQLIESQRIAHIGNWERNVVTNRVTGSDELYRLWDISPRTTELNLQMILDRIHPDDRERFIQAGKEAVYENKPYSIDFRVISRGGTEAVIHSRGEVIRDKEGKPIFFRGTVQDITESKKLEAQLLQAHKMEAVGLLAGGIAHDFNNILTAIIGYGSIMQMKMRKDDPLTKPLDNILVSAQRAAALTQNLLAFSRKQVMQIQPVDMNQIVRNVDNLLSRIIGEDVELRTTLAQGEVIIQADRGQIEQVLMNLATNARDAMPGGGTLSIETSRATVDPEIMGISGFAPSGSYALLTVSDTGEGLDEITKKRMFDPFFTTKEVNKGTGLGLSIVYGIIKQHEGYISVDSVVGKGTTFRIYLPLSQSTVEEKRSKEFPVSRGGSETILYADDDTAIRAVMEEVLTSAGYTVIAAHDGEDAIHKFIENKDKIHLLVLDVIMPKKSGKEAYDAIKQMRSDIKVLFISGYSADIIQKRGVMEESVNFLYKPVTPNVLLQKVRDVLR